MDNFIARLWWISFPTVYTVSVHHYKDYCFCLDMIPVAGKYKKISPIAAGLQNAMLV